MMHATYVLSNILVATLKIEKGTGDINFNSTFYLFQCIQNTIISTCE